MPKPVLLLLFMLTCAGALRAQPVTPLTPEEAVRLAWEQSNLLEAGQAQLAGARAQFQELRTAFYPTVGSRAQYRRLSPNVDDIGLDSASFPGLDTAFFDLFPIYLNQYSVELNIEQPVFSGFRLRNEAQAGADRVEAAQHELTATRAAVALQALEAYWSLAQAQAQQTVSEAAIKQLEEQLRNVQNRRDVGLALERDVLSLRTRLAEVRLDAVDADHAVRLAELELRNMLDLPQDVRIEPQAEPETGLIETTDVAELVNRSLTERANIQAQAKQVEALQNELEVARAGWYPDVSAFGRIIYGRPNPNLFVSSRDPEATWEVGVTASMDLWDWGRTRSQVRQAEARLVQATEQLEMMRDSVELEATRQYLNVIRAREALAAAEIAVQEAEEAYDVIRDRYGQGLALTADLLEAEAAYRRASARLAAGRAERALAVAALRAAVGEDEIWR
jgi:outer membrane protein TolC